MHSLLRLQTFTVGRAQRLLRGAAFVHRPTVNKGRGKKKIGTDLVTEMRVAITSINIFTSTTSLLAPDINAPSSLLLLTANQHFQVEKKMSSETKDVTDLMRAEFHDGPMSKKVSTLTALGNTSTHAPNPAREDRFETTTRRPKPLACKSINTANHSHFPPNPGPKRATQIPHEMARQRPSPLGNRERQQCQSHLEIPRHDGIRESC